MSVQLVPDAPALHGDVKMGPAAEYAPGVAQALTAILHGTFAQYTAHLARYSTSSVSASALLARGFNHALFPQRLDFIKTQALAFQRNPNIELVTQLRAFDPARLKDYLIAKGFFESEFVATLGLGDSMWSEEQRKYVTVLFIMLLGSGDAISIYFLLSAIDRHLSEHALKINRRKYLFLAGLNNMTILFRLKEVHSKHQDVFRIEDLFDIVYTKRRSRTGAQGCPFVVYEMAAVNAFLDVLDGLFEKIFAEAPTITCPNAFGHELLSAKPLLSPTPFAFDRDALLDSEFVSEIK